MPPLLNNLKSTVTDPFKKLFAKKPTPTTPAIPVSTPIPGRVPGEQGFEITRGSSSTSAPSPVVPMSMTGTGQVGPLAPKIPIQSTTTPTPKPTSGFSPMAIPEVKNDTNAQGLLINPPDAQFDRNTGLRIGADTAPNTPSTPPVPVITPEGEKAVNKAEEAYQQGLKISPEELSTEEDLEKFYEATRLSLKELEGQGRGIPLSIVRGQQEKLYEQSEIHAQTLESRLARLQAARIASLEASKFALERADKKEEVEKEAIKPISGTSFYDPVTGTFKQAPSTTSAKPAEGFTLSPGELRYDANGKLIASGGVKPVSDAVSIKMTEKAEEKSEALKKGRSDATGGLALVNEILNSPYINQVFGAKNPLTYWTPGSNEQLVKSQRDQLIAMLSLENRSKLKGSGAISDFEAKTLEKAASALNKSLSDNDAKRVLKQIKGAFATSAGLEAEVKVTSPTGESLVSTATRDEINKLIAEGNVVEYQ